jgi:hypothetical protein
VADCGAIVARTRPEATERLRPKHQVPSDRAVAPSSPLDTFSTCHGSWALGDFRPGGSGVDLLVVSDEPTGGRVSVVEREWKHEPTNLDLRVVRYDVAAKPTRAPRVASTCHSPPSTASTSNTIRTSPT